VSCHDPKVFFTDPDNKEPTSEGIIEGRFGPRNAPTLMYNLPTPPFHFDKAEGLFKGGQFVDGRARTTVDQAKGPPLSPIEMNNQNALEVVEKVRSASYANLFRRVYGNAALDNPAKAYNRIAEAIAAFERTPVFTPMTSKYDYYLQGKANFTAQERRGRLVFEAEDKGNCAACHPSRPDNNGAQRPLFTDFTYDNLGVPKNRPIPFINRLSSSIRWAMAMWIEDWATMCSCRAKMASSKCRRSAISRKRRPTCTMGISKPCAA